MTAMQQFNITLPTDLAEAIEGRIQSGAYSSVSEAVREALHILLEQDAAVEQWLRGEVLAGHQEYLADPSQGVPIEDVLARIKATVLNASRI
jgi:putative addiction module CopG family antidote